MLFSAEIYIFNIVSAEYSQVFTIFAAVLKKCNMLIGRKNEQQGRTDTRKNPKANKTIGRGHIYPSARRTGRMWIHPQLCRLWQGKPRHA